MNGEDRHRIAAELTDGKSVVGVLAATEQAAQLSAKLAELGGITRCSR